MIPGKDDEVTVDGEVFEWKCCDDFGDYHNIAYRKQRPSGSRLPGSYRTILNDKGEKRKFPSKVSPQEFVENATKAVIENVRLEREAERAAQRKG